MGSQQYKHIPVMLEEALELNIRDRFAKYIENPAFLKFSFN